MPAEKRLRRQTTEEVAAKACEDNYEKYLSEDEIYVHKKGKFTLFDQTVADLRKKKTDPTFVMGGRYYADHRVDWRSSTHPATLMTVPEGTAAGKVSPALMRAMVAVKRNRLDIDGVIFYMAQAAKPNLSELVGIYKWALGLNVKNDKMLGALLDVMRYSRRHDLDVAFPNQFGLMTATFERGLMWLRKKHAKVASEKFVENNEAAASVLLPRAEILKVWF